MVSVQHSYMRELSSDNWINRLESMGRSDSGVLLFELNERVVGSILFEHGRVCWAVAKASSLGPFVQRIAEATDLPMATVLGVFRRCRKEHLPLWDTLLTEAMLSDAALREAVKAQCVEACLQIEEARPSARRWVERPTLGSRYGIPMIELVGAVAARRAPTLAAEVQGHLGELRERGFDAMAFIDGLPLCSKRVCATWPELVELFSWANDRIRAMRRFTDGKAMIVQWQEHFVLLAPRGRVLYVAQGEARQLGRLLHAIPTDHGQSPRLVEDSKSDWAQAC